MPTFAVRARFWRDYEKLSPDQRRTFAIAIARFVADLRSGSFRKGLRVRGIVGSPGVFEMTWAPNGRATFHIGEERVAGETHIVWRRIGTHDIFESP